MELKYYTILTSPNYNNPSLLVKDWNKENYPFGFDGVNHDGTECIWAQGQEVYIKKDVDEAIAELQSENAELKKKLMPCLNGDCILTCEVIEKYGKENAELKQKLESVQASMYADVVDANMEVRRLKRALWIARAERAKTEHLSKIMYSTLFRDFIEKWVNVERKCRAKAEEYK